jgi:hypothetical protein
LSGLQRFLAPLSIEGANREHRKTWKSPMLGESDNRGELKRPLRALWERYYCREDSRVTFVRFARSGDESELNSDSFFSSAREGTATFMSLSPWKRFWASSEDKSFVKRNSKAP